MKKFEKECANENNVKWTDMIERKQKLYHTEEDIRSPFERDFTRILHSNAYRRLKHKTQVFYSPENDHICTRIEHVNYVESISYTIANYLGLNTELTRAISIGHDVGHSPFGHQGESILSKISKADLNKPFWHEKNGLYMVDNIELLEDYQKNKQNLNLTYAVRDGIISHCGEIDENIIKPRNEKINLENDYNNSNQYAPYTWEGCIVKIADKISYIGRDIEDGIELGILDDKLEDLYKILGKKVNNTIIINELVSDVCKNSSPEIGLKFSEEALEMMNKIKEYNYKNIYGSEVMKPSKKYFELVINQIYDTLKSTYDAENTPTNIKKMGKFYPKLSEDFYNWISQYWNYGSREGLKNKILYDIKNEKDYKEAIISFISGMTDKFAMEMYSEIIHF